MVLGIHAMDKWHLLHDTVVLGINAMDKGHLLHESRDQGTSGVVHGCLCHRVQHHVPPRGLPHGLPSQDSSCSVHHLSAGSAQCTSGREAVGATAER